MQWLWLVLLAALAGVFVNIIDKWMLTNRIRDAVAYQIFLAPFYVVALALSYPFAEPATFIVAALSTLAGSVIGVSNILYNKALLHEEASKVADLLYMDVIFILPLAALFLGEVLTAPKYAGVLLIASAATLVSYKRAHGHFIMSPALLWMLALDAISAMVWVLHKYLISQAGVFTILFWLFFGTIIGRTSLLLLPGVRQGFRKQAKHMNGLALMWGFADALFVFASAALWLSALTQQYVSLANAVLAIQPFFLLVIAFVLSKMGINIGENVSAKNEGIKLVAVVMLIVGMWLVVG